MVQFRMNRTLRYAFLALLALSVASLACQFNLGGPEPPATTIEVSDSAASELESEWTSALEGAQASDGRVVLILTQEQLTSYAALTLAEEPDAVLQEPQIFLQEGVIQVHGVAQQDFVRAAVLFEVVPVIEADGSLSFNISSAQFGPVPMPDSLKSSISSLISEALAGAIGPYATGLRIESVAIHDGEMAISALVR